MGKKLVLDTSALFSMEQLPADSEAFVTPGVLKELERYKDRRASLWGEMLHVSEATKGSLAKVRQAASETGDSTRISPTDAEVIALALDLDAELLTDDYSVQNVASHLGMPFRPVGIKAIKEVRKWRWRCVGCGKVFDKELPECSICGSRLKSTLSRKQ
ncbi:MAG: nucleic acid-binding protein [Methanomassiliicoccales archaeon]|nr:nucleic acid-binding protein [Methanomassiliicoccales archaeon]